MERRVGVTGGAGRREAVKDAIGMALRTGQPGMCTGQGNFCERMVERSRKPAAGGVAGAAALAKLTCVGIIFYVAGIAVLGGRL